MNLKSIRESYSKLLKAINDAGVKLNESQKADIDAFVLAIESNMSRQRKTAIRQTAKLVEKKMEKEYRQVFESIMANMQENAALAAKIQTKVAQINEQKKMADHVDNFLDLYVESVLPKKSIVDYDRMQKLEKIHESLKDALLVTEDDVESKIHQLEESYKLKQSKCETEVAKARAALNESIKKNIKLGKQLDEAKATALLESKTKDLPAYESKRVKKALKEATAPEIEKKFDKTLKEVRKEMDLHTECDEDETEVETEIDKILETDTNVEEDDMLKNRVHNLHKDAKLQEGEDEEDGKDLDETDSSDIEEDDMLKNRVHNLHKDAKLQEGEDEEFETVETVKETEDGDVELDDCDIVDESIMKYWCSRCMEEN